MNIKVLSHKPKESPLFHFPGKNPYILPAVLAVTFLILILETLKYPGFVGNHFYIDSKVFFAAALILMLFHPLPDTKIMRIVLKLNRLLLAGITLTYFYFILLEGSHFTNYVLSRFHFHLDGMILLLLFSLSIFLIDRFRNEIPKPAKNSGIIYPLTLFLLSFFVIKNLSISANTAFNRDSYILFHLKSTYDERLSYQWKVFYEFMIFVRNNTPENAVIMIPPEQDPWLMGSGNENFVRAFIYPRKIVPETLTIPDKDLKSPGPNTYILITWGKESCKPEPDCHGWPRQAIAAKKIIYKDPLSTRVIEVEQNTKYIPKGSKYVYGLIEI